MTSDRSRRCAALATVLMLGWFSIPQDMPAQCDQLVFARANPILCSSDPFGLGPGSAPSTGGNGSRGLIGGLLHTLGGLL